MRPFPSRLDVSPSLMCPNQERQRAHFAKHGYVSPIWMNTCPYQKTTILNRVKHTQAIPATPYNQRREDCDATSGCPYWPLRLLRRSSARLVWPHARLKITNTQDSRRACAEHSSFGHFRTARPRNSTRHDYEATTPKVRGGLLTFDRGSNPALHKLRSFNTLFWKKGGRGQRICSCGLQPRINPAALQPTSCDRACFRASPVLPAPAKGKVGSGVVVAATPPSIVVERAIAKR